MRRCASIRRAWLLSRGTVQPDIFPDMRYWRPPMCCCPCICCIATRGIGGIRTRFFRSVRAGSRRRAPCFRLHAVRGRPAPLHRRDFALYEMLMHLHRRRRHFRLIHVPDKPIELEARSIFAPVIPAHEAGTSLMSNPTNATTYVTTLAELLRPTATIRQDHLPRGRARRS